MIVQQLGKIKVNPNQTPYIEIVRSKTHYGYLQFIDLLEGQIYILCDDGVLHNTEKRYVGDEYGTEI